MGWVTALAQLLGAVAWPVAVVTFLIMFRREIRRRLSAVREVKYPGGSITLGDVEKLEAAGAVVAGRDVRESSLALQKRVDTGFSRELLI